MTQGGRGFVLCSGLSTPWRDFLLRVQHAGFVSQALSLEGHCVEAEGFALPSAARRIG